MPVDRQGISKSTHLLLQVRVVSYFAYSTARVSRRRFTLI